MAAQYNVADKPQHVLSTLAEHFQEKGGTSPLYKY